MQNQMPPGRDNIPLNHPRRIAKLAATCSDHALQQESEEVRRLVAEYRQNQRDNRAAHTFARLAQKP